MLRPRGALERIIVQTALGLLLVGCLPRGLVANCAIWSGESQRANIVVGDEACKRGSHECMVYNFREKLAQLVDDNGELASMIHAYLITLPSTPKSRHEALTFVKLANEANAEPGYAANIKQYQYNWIEEVVDIILNDQLALKADDVPGGFKCDCGSRKVQNSKGLKCCPSCCTRCDSRWYTDNCYASRGNVTRETDHTQVSATTTTEAPVASTTEQPERAKTDDDDDGDRDYDGDENAASERKTGQSLSMRKRAPSVDRRSLRVTTLNEMIDHLPSVHVNENVVPILASLGEPLEDAHFKPDADPISNPPDRLRRRPNTDFRHNSFSDPQQQQQQQQQPQEGPINWLQVLNERSLPSNRTIKSPEGFVALVKHLLRRLLERKHRCPECPLATPVCRPHAPACPSDNKCQDPRHDQCLPCRKRCPTFGAASSSARLISTRNTVNRNEMLANLRDNCRGPTCWFRKECGKAPLNPLSGGSRLVSASNSAPNEPRSENTEFIVNGSPQKYGEFPSYVRLYLPSYDAATNKTVAYTCGGAIVSDRHILTAGHCLFDPAGRPIPRQGIVAIIGDHNTRTLDRHEKGYRVESVCVSKRARIEAGHWIYDYGVLKLESRILFHDYSQPACLPYESAQTLLDGSQENDTDTNVCYLTGAGSIGFDSHDDAMFPDAVQKLSVRRWPCKPFGFEDDEARLCLTKVDQQGNSCVGDSGSPILCLQPKNRRWLLVGMVSYGPNKCKPPPGKDWVTVATRLAMLLPYIKQDCGI